MGVLFSSLELSPEIRDVALQEAMRGHGEIDVQALNAQPKRIARAYGDGAYSDAEYEARRSLVSPMLDQVYVDRDSKLLVGIAPTPGFRALLQGAVRTAPGAPV